jgi:hypothetical protein
MLPYLLFRSLKTDVSRKVSQIGTGCEYVDLIEMAQDRFQIRQGSVASSSEHDDELSGVLKRPGISLTASSSRTALLRTVRILLLELLLLLLLLLLLSSSSSSSSLLLLSLPSLHYPKSDRLEMMFILKV